ncbi:TetR-like C-terminal domain-containing protein [Nonomuraea fuscirosea]|uniref:TetR-like C-terminal domain-containing protein n=1 Tax=Nonomuraea fuscirosea TaxID=1291556 RepID=UPI00343B651D
MELTELAAAAWPSAKATQASTDHLWPDFSPGLADTIREHFPDLPPAAVALALRMWGRMHGLISLEVYGHLGTRSGDPAKLYHAELLDLLRSLRLDVEHPRHLGTPRPST